METIAELFDLTGNGAIVTGGAMGIGQAIAFRLSEAGAGVTIADVDLEAAEETVDKIKYGDESTMEKVTRKTTEAVEDVKKDMEK